MNPPSSPPEDAAFPPHPPAGAPEPQRTPEQLATVRRRALPVAIAALICGVISVAIPWTVQISALGPPSAFAMNMAFCAMLMGVGIFFYAKGTPGTRAAAILCVLAVLLGMVGIYEYSRQAVSFRGLREGRELENIRAIALAAKTYAEEHDGQYPPNLLVLLEEKRLTPRTLQSPFGQRSEVFDHFSEEAAKLSPADLLKSVESASDYLYHGADLHHVPPDLAKELIVASSNNTVLRMKLAIAFADGTARFIGVEEVPQVMKSSNEAREHLGLGPLRPPAIIQQALDEKAGKRVE